MPGGVPGYKGWQHRLPPLARQSRSEQHSALAHAFGLASQEQQVFIAARSLRKQQLNMPAPTEPTEGFSPITMNQAWPKMNRLLITASACIFSALFNCFFIAAFFVEDALKRIGFVFLACVGLSEIVITGGVLPVVSVVLLSGEWDNAELCYVLQFLTESSTYSYSLFFTLVAAETYIRLCRTDEEYERFISMPVGSISLLVFIICFATAAVGVYLELDYDYCLRAHYGNIYFRVATDLLLHVIPGFFIMFCFISAIFSMRRRAKEQAHYRRSQKYENDRSTNTLNITAYVLYAGSWMPHLFVVYENPAASDSRYYYFVWFGIARSILTSFLYGILERSFRRAFAYLVNYCCFKSTLSGNYAGRHRRNYEYKPPAGDVRVHIMQAGVSTSSPQRASSSTRETQEL